jgi:gliding motility-associated lipoprotein GldB
LKQVKFHFTFLFFTIILFGFSISSCDKKTKIEKQVEEIPVEIKVVRFDKAFFEAKPQDLPFLKADYPFFFEGTDDNVLIDKMKNPLWRELYQEVQKKFPDFSKQTKEIETLFQHIQFYFPKTQTPICYTVIGEMDYLYKTIYANDKIIISLELYLGKEHKFYEFPAYIKQNFEERQMMPDLVTSFALRAIPVSEDKSFLSEMIYYGKELYLKDILLPNYTDAEKIGYTPDQDTWAKENESYIWRYFIDENLLYSTDSRLPNRFINLAPFSKFYLEIDNDSPGRIGQWMGWQIVKSFMENNPKVTVQQLLKLEAKQIFERSKYKPKKTE